MKAEVDRKKQRRKRHMRARRKLVGTDERPRLAVCCTLKHIYAQIINDWEEHTLVSAATVEKEIADQCNGSTANQAAAEVVGRVIDERALAVQQVEPERRDDHENRQHAQRVRKSPLGNVRRLGH